MLESPQKEMYAKERFTALQAQRLAQEIAFGPIVFQVSRLMVKFGIFQMLDDCKGGMTMDEIAQKANLSHYGAQVLLGFLWGDGAPERTIRIACRGGYDSDCNPSTAGGVLFTMLGERRLPEKFKRGIDETKKFEFTDYTFRYIISNPPFGIDWKREEKAVKAEAQKDLMNAMLPKLTEEEMTVFKRGRNANSHSVAKHASVTDYRIATGFEALLGYLYLCGRTDRIMELVFPNEPENR